MHGGAARRRPRAPRSRSARCPQARSSRSRRSRKLDARVATLSLPADLSPVLDAVAAVAEPYEGVYLVGGTVRDILLGERNFDVDIVVEGDAIALARVLAGALDGRVRTHAKFGTAVVLYEEDQRVDVV